MNRYLLIAVVLITLVAVAVAVGRRSARRLVRTRRIRIDRFKLRRKHTEIQMEVFSDKEVVAAIRHYAREHKVPIEEAHSQAQTYLSEIVPKFNLLAYYKVGAPIARAILNFLYRVVVERNTLREFSDKARGGVVVYVINHRSNADYVLVAHMLFRFVSLSYAIGEWARVWPLNHIFKWFGGYFVRRRYREPLYHAILRAFVQTITRNGVTQGIFIEGGLTRDGAFLKPKLGMLDYLVTSKQDPAFTQPLYLVPTAINYDRTLEDRTLTEELLGREDRSTRLEKFRTTLDFLFKNFFRSLLHRFKRYGYAVVSFAEPILIDDAIRRNPLLLAETFEERKPALQALADEVMRHISDALPLTPVPVVARVFSEGHGDGWLSEQRIIEDIGRIQEKQRERVWLTRERSADEIWRSARTLLELRHLIVQEGSTFRWNPQQALIRDYYANSLLSYDEVKARGWPQRESSKGGISAVRHPSSPAPA